MTIIQIVAFLTVVEEGSFSAASEKLYLSQSSISKHIRNLEKDLSVSLLIRDNRRCRLTEAGEVMYPQMQKLYQDFQSVQAARNEYLGYKKRTLDIAILPVAGQCGFIDLLAAFQQKTGYTIQISELENDQLISSLIQKNHEFVFARRDNLDLEVFDFALFQEDQWVCVVPEKSPLAQRMFLSLEELKDQQFIMLEEAAGMYHSMIQICSAAGYMPNIVHVVSRIMTAIRLVANQQGIAVLFQKTLQGFSCDSVRLIPLVPQIRGEMGMVWLRSTSLKKVQREFLDYMEDWRKQML